LIKPVGIESLLSTVKEQLRLQKEEKKFTEQKVAEFIEVRTRRNHLLNEVNGRNRKRTQKIGS
jgi:hypothetical protein